MNTVKYDNCSKVQALGLLSLDLEQLLEISRDLTARNGGRKFSFCGIMNVKSGACSEDCRYCSQSAHYDGECETYGLLDTARIVEQSKRMYAEGIEYFGIVSSGEAMSSDDLRKLADTIRAIKKACGIKMCASLGHLKSDEIKMLAAAGLSRYHHNFETSEKFYPQICSTHNWKQRLETVKAAKAAGIELCCGGLFGLGESWQDRIDLAFTLRDLQIKNVPLNFLDPRPGTPLGDRPVMSPDEALRIIALFRIILPDAVLRVCGGRPAVFAGCMQRLVDSGINGLMTGDYLTTAGISPATDREMINACGFEL